MKKSLRFISLLLAMVFLISGAVMVVCHAEPNNNAQPAQNDPQPAQNDQQQAQNDPQPAQNDQQQAQNDQQTAQNDQSSGNNSYDTGNNGYDNQNNYDSGNNSNSYNDYSNNNAGTVENQDPIYYGDPSNSNNYVVNSTESAAGSVSSSLYNSSGMSAEDAKPNEWSDITLDEKTVQTGVTDFSSIKENTKQEDNGNWILYLGYVLLGLAGLGILYFIIATIAHRNAVKKAERLEQRRRNSSSPSHSAAARMEERERREEYEDEAPRRRRSRYADEDDVGYSRRASSRYDTGEVYVPRRAAKR